MLSLVEESPKERAAEPSKQDRRSRMTGEKRARATARLKAPRLRTTNCSVFFAASVKRTSRPSA